MIWPGALVCSFLASLELNGTLWAVSIAVMLFAALMILFRVLERKR